MSNPAGNGTCYWKRVLPWPGPPTLHELDLALAEYERSQHAVEKQSGQGPHPAGQHPEA